MKTNEDIIPVIIGLNLFNVTFFAWATALGGWSMLWWIVSFSLLVLPKQEEK